jgi:predicted ATPase/class 3 adenylate cyclase
MSGAGTSGDGPNDAGARTRGRAFAFLFTDIEGSTRLWEAHPDAMRSALALHDALLRRVVAEHGGTVFKALGDGVCAAFASTRAEADAVEAAVAAQRALAATSWPAPVQLRARMAVHVGEAERRDDDYFGPALNRVARLLQAGHGGQTLASQAVLAGMAGGLALPLGAKPLGSHRLRDLAEPETIFEITHPELASKFPPLRTLETHPHNLPVQLTQFIGREREVADILRRLETERLVTVAGPGGCGKTRVCLQAAADALPRFPGGAWLVELAAVTDGALVPAVVATALGVREEAGCAIAESLARAIRSRRLLLLLDNCEHLLPEVCAVAALLLARCPELRILATSREALGLAGEATVRIPSLALPPAEPTDLAALHGVESVQLFLDRVRLVRHDFLLTAANAGAVASVCRRLDGIPLAIELAAARVRSLAVEEVDRRLDDRFRLLTGGSRIALPRHRTLRALIDWSYDLLSLPERAVLQRASVFTGGWTLESADGVCADANDAPGAAAPPPHAANVPAAGIRVEAADVLDLLTALVDRSLVIATESEGRTRYRMLETVRQYARDRLFEAGEAGAVWRRFARCFCTLAEQLWTGLFGAEQARSSAAFTADHDNFRAALDWCRDEDPDACVALTSMLADYWYVTGNLTDGRRRVGDAIRLCESRPDLAHVRLLLAGSALARDQGDLDAAEQFAARGLVLSRELPRRSAEARALHSLALAASDRGEVDRAEPLYRESMAIWSELGDPRGVAMALLGLALAAEQADRFADAEGLAAQCLTHFRELHDAWGIATALNVLGVARCNLGDYAAAAATHDESLALQRGLGNRRGIALSLGNLGQVALRRGDLERAGELLRESLGIFDDLSDRWGIAQMLATLGLLAAQRDGHARALTLLASARDLARAAGIQVPLGEGELDEALARSAAELDRSAGSAASASAARGQPLAIDAAIACAMEA